MKPVKAVELTKLGTDELQSKLAEKRQELFNLRFQKGTAQLEKTADLKATRRDVARILTVLKQKEESHV